jgi:predicted transcriptional regulator
MRSADSEELNSIDFLSVTGQIVSAYFSNNAVPAADVPAMIKSVHSALSNLGSSAGETTTSQKPAVPVRKSITADYIVCLEDGKKLKMLKRYLRSNYKLTPDEYRAKWNLPRDYPMVAPNYAKQRSEFAKKIGLGTTGKKPRRRKRA